MAGHTPGQWRVEGRRGPGYIISAGVNLEGDGPAEYVGVIDPMFHVAGEGAERHAANAALIAAAPDMLAALKRLTDLASFEAGTVNPSGAFWDALEAARTAITQAEKLDGGVG